LASVSSTLAKALSIFPSGEKPWYAATIMTPPI
jgi:hypothetical protein